MKFHLFQGPWQSFRDSLRPHKVKYKLFLFCYLIVLSDGKKAMLFLIAVGFCLSPIPPTMLTLFRAQLTTRLESGTQIPSNAYTRLQNMEIRWRSEWSMLNTIFQFFNCLVCFRCGALLTTSTAVTWHRSQKINPYTFTVLQFSKENECAFQQIIFNGKKTCDKFVFCFLLFVFGLGPSPLTPSGLPVVHLRFLIHHRTKNTLKIKTPSNFEPKNMQSYIWIFKTGESQNTLKSSFLWEISLVLYEVENTHY